jgi:DNA-binding response OmpR family regulator
MNESFILFVHPERDIPQELISLARKLPATVLYASTCEQARSVLTEKPVDLVVTALSLPDGNWDCVFRSLVEIDSTASVLVITPEESEHLRDEIAGRGGSGLLVEPLTRNQGATLLTLLEQSWKLGLAGRSRTS